MKYIDKYNKKVMLKKKDLKKLFKKVSIKDNTLKAFGIKKVTRIVFKRLKKKDKLNYVNIISTILSVFDKYKLNSKYLKKVLLKQHLEYKHKKKVRVYLGDCITNLKLIPDDSIDCCVTSPPYFGLRDYGITTQIGHEKTPEEFVDKMVEVFTEVKRVLKPTGTLWLNLGDSYSGSSKGRNADGSSNPGKSRIQSSNKGAVVGKLFKTKVNLPRKNLIGIPWLVAFALQKSGWILRQDIIWKKENCFPESVKDRFTKSHEYIFLMSKKVKYFFDNISVKEKTVDKKGLRNRRSVWDINTKPYKGAHFAVYPPDLIEPCILAGCPKKGIVLDPFGGSGTTGLVALKNKRKAILMELNPEYIPLIKERLTSLK